LVRKDSFSKNDEAWERIFEEFDIDSKIAKGEIFHITADQMSKATGREPRLLSKMESRENVPAPLKDRDLCIMPYMIRGSYAIGRFDAFVKLDYASIRGKRIILDKRYDTLDPYSISNEPALILSAFNYGVIDDIGGEKRGSFSFTNFGRESSGDFEFRIGDVKQKHDYHISVQGSQIEMDGVFESKNTIINVEAKIGVKTDFMARQLYYPYRMLEGQSDKEILNVFMTYSSGSLYAHVFSVEDPFNYNSLKLVSRKRYDFYKEIRTSDIRKILSESFIVSDPKNVPTPQANTFQMVLDTLDLIRTQPGIKYPEIADSLGVESRQGNYYGNSCRYLGLCRRSGRPNGLFLTDEGEEYFKLPIRDRILKVVEIMSRRPVFNYFLKKHFLENVPVEGIDIAKWYNERGYHGSWEMDKRRGESAKRWIDWVIDRCTVEP